MLQSKMVLKEAKSIVFRIFGYAILYYGAIIGAYVALFNVIYRFVTVNHFKYIPTKERELPPAILNDVQFGTHCYIQIRNVKLHYVENGDKSKPLMLFLHGFADFWYSWREQLPVFSKHYWTVAIDMRGFGDSEKPYGLSPYHLKHLVNDVKNVVEALGRDKCILVAHDWGAVVAWHAILHYPNIFEKYIIIGIPPVYAVKLKPIQVIRSWYVFFFQLPYLPELWLNFEDMGCIDVAHSSSSVEVREAYKFTFGKPGGFTSGINYYRENICILTNTCGKKISDVKFPPGFLIYTDNDKCLDKSSFEGSEKIPNLKTEIIGGAGHFIHQVKPVETNKAISQFLGITHPDEHDGYSEPERSTAYDENPY